VAQCNDLNLKLVPRSQTGNDRGEHGKQDGEHELRGYQLDPVSAMSSIWTEFSAVTRQFHLGLVFSPYAI
jgi:hypothetical protein